MKNKKNFQSLILNRERAEEIDKHPFSSTNRRYKRETSVPAVCTESGNNRTKFPFLYKFSGKESEKNVDVFKKSVMMVKLKRAKSLRKTDFYDQKEDAKLAGSPTLPTLASLKANLKKKNWNLKRLKSRYLSSEASTVLNEDNQKKDILFYGGPDWKKRASKIYIENFKDKNYREIPKIINTEESNILKSTAKNITKLRKSLNSGLLADINRERKKYGSVKEELKHFKKKRMKQHAFKTVVDKKIKLKEDHKRMNPNYDKLKNEIFLKGIEYKKDKFFDNIDKKYKKKIGVSTVDKLKEKHQNIQKFTFENFVMLLQSLYGHKNKEIIRSIRFFRENDFDSFIKEFKFLLESTKHKELIKFEKFLRTKINDEEYKEGYRGLATSINRYNIITGLRQVYDNEKLFQSRNFDVWTLEGSDKKKIQPKLIDKNFMKKMTRLDMKYGS